MTFDEEYDVVVAGFGFAGATTAIEAARRGARVLVLEKSSVPGGISICSYGSVRSARDASAACNYLTHTNGGRTDPGVIAALAQGMTEQEDYVRDLARINGAEVTTNKDSGRTGAIYPLPGYETFYQTLVGPIEGFSARESYPWANGAPGGPLLFKVLHDNLDALKVPVRYEARAWSLLTDGASRAVVGVVVQTPQGETRIRARGGVVLACGGFEGSDEFKQQFWEGQPVLSAAARSNTGDGIVMAQSLGAKLWHMWHFHGGYGFRSDDPSYPYAIRVKRLPDWIPNAGFIARKDESGKGEVSVKMAWVLLDKGGNRFMNEYQPYLQDTAHRAMHLFDPVTQDYPRLPCALICDEDGRKLYPLGKPTSNDEGIRTVWSDDNMREVEAGILKRADSIGELAVMLGLDPGKVEASVERWNAFCDASKDADFERPPGSMIPIRTPPFYGAPVWPVVSNTQGGPVHDAEQRIIDVYGEPIPGLYAAGELGSSFGHLYMSGGNISECLITGRIAGRNAAAGRA